jgi:hypothetical protein
MTKPLYSAVLACLVVGLASCPAGAISLDVVPSAQTVSLGSAATAAVTISDLTDLAAPSLGTFDLALTFDPAILAFVGLTFGDPVLGDQLDLSGLGSLSSVTSGAGSVSFFELSLDSIDDLNDLQAGAFTLATLTFTAVGSGTSALGLEVNALGDALGVTLVLDAVAGASIAVPEPVATPEPPALLLLASGIAGLGGVTTWRRHRRRFGRGSSPGESR